MKSHALPTVDFPACETHETPHGSGLYMPVFLLIIACALWAVSFPLVKALHLEQTARMPGVSSLFLASWMQMARFGLGAAMLVPFIIGKKRPTSLEIRQALVLAFWGGSGMWLQADALAYTAASTSAFVTQAYCIFLPLWACLQSRQAPTARVVGATLMVLTGGAILSGLRPGDLRLGRGEIETIGAAFLFTFQILALENPRYEGNRGLPVTFVMFLGIAVLLAPVTLISAPNLAACVSAGASLPAFAIIGSLALFCSVGAYLLMNIWQPRVSATEAGLIYTTEPVFTAGYVLFLPAVLGTFIHGIYPNESLSTTTILGGGLILAANILMQWKRPPHLPAAGPVS
ncbi:MAG: DMT family transporter [Luteolibacter sp.]|uniref:DMT family transporter n=1 Tax=Luteolibacter sp. TaxID=1962973 RepID=UPI003267385C